MKKLKILAKTYDVKKGNTKKLAKEYGVEDDKFCLFGFHSTFRNEIWLNQDVGDQELRVTLMHECIHSILGQLGYIELDSNEIFINGFSTALVQLLIDNPKLLEMYRKVG